MKIRKGKGFPLICWPSEDFEVKNLHFDGKERCEILAEYVIETGATVRTTASAFGISKSTVHKDLTVKLRQYHSKLYRDVKHILDKNKSERHLRGGEATRQKYLHARTGDSNK